MTAEAWGALLLLVLGFAMGAGWRDMHKVMMGEAKDAKHKETLGEKDAEIKRLRTLVASIIGREDRLTAAEMTQARTAAGPRPDPETEFMLGL